MGYKYTTSINPTNGAIEKVVAEGFVDGRPWVVLDCLPVKVAYNQYMQNISTMSAYQPRRLLRISFSDFGVGSYISLFVADWKSLYFDLARIKSSAGRAYSAMFGVSAEGMWEENPGVDGELYAEAEICDDLPFEQAAREFIEALSPILVRMAVTVPMSPKVDASRKEMTR